MAVEDNKTVVRRWFEEVWNQGKTASIDNLAAESLVLHHSALPAAVHLERYKQLHAMFHAAFPDLLITIEDLVAEGDKVVARLVQRATHQGEFRGIPATGKQVTQTAIVILRIEDGKVAEAWAQEDSWTAKVASLAAQGDSPGMG